MGQKKMTKEKAAELARAERSIEAAGMAELGYTHEMIAEALGVSQGTVVNDLNKLLTLAYDEQVRIGRQFLAVQVNLYYRALQQAFASYEKGVWQEGNNVYKFLGRIDALLGLEPKEQGGAPSGQLHLSFSPTFVNSPAPNAGGEIISQTVRPEDVMKKFLQFAASEVQVHEQTEQEIIGLEG